MALRLEAELLRRLDSKYVPEVFAEVAAVGVGLFLAEGIWFNVADFGMRGGGGMPSCLSLLEVCRWWLCA